MLSYPLSAVSDSFGSRATPRTDELITTLAARHGDEFVVTLAGSYLVGRHGDRTGRDAGLLAMIEQLTGSGLHDQEATSLLCGYLAQFEAALRTDLHDHQHTAQAGHQASRYCPALRRQGASRPGDAS
ncbi:hypothetical protein [Nocardia blacklockiae]|uniref:hypothetical protein n=1 Tax=Nocardia blacklockiae TaxID=480036 RepID=UPI001894F24D|nr:hypothetical protein [Nocardia blacklockiae]MBF6176011.1 hypothetical protein [Nocardia blacklockiae]